MLFVGVKGPGLFLHAVKANDLCALDESSSKSSNTKSMQNDESSSSHSDSASVESIEVDGYYVLGAVVYLHLTTSSRWFDVPQSSVKRISGGLVINNKRLPFKTPKSNLTPMILPNSTVDHADRPTSSVLSN